MCWAGVGGRRVGEARGLQWKDEVHEEEEQPIRNFQLGVLVVN